MRIAFDATVLHGRMSGIGYYCEELLKAVVAADNNNEYFVFSHRALDLESATADSRVTFSRTGFFPIRAIYLHCILPGVLNRVQPDICHYTNFLAPIRSNQPYVVTIHDMGLESLRRAHPLVKRLYTKQLIPWVARKARLILTNSEFSKWQIVRYLGVPEKQIRVTPLAASSEFCPGRVAVDRPYYLFVGNLEPRKNLKRLLQAFARLPSKTHDLVIVGNPWYKGSEAQHDARRLGIEGRVRFSGYVAREELPDLYRGATAFVYPSLLEGFGLPVVEAMACGTPVVTSDNSSLREVAGDAAWLVNPDDVLEICEAMTAIGEDHGIRNDLSCRGLARSAQFSWEKTARLTLEAYQEASGCSPCHVPRKGADMDLPAAVQKTISYSRQFQYPLRCEEARERLFGIQIDKEAFEKVWNSIDSNPDPGLLELRAEREAISDRAVREAEPHLKTLASIPFVRMIAFSGATAHRNMTSTHDLDLFIVVEDGKVWAVFLTAMIWAKIKRLRKHLCMNYVVSDKALPLFETDAFTAQQVASLKPVYGKNVYDRFIDLNPFVYRHFPNFDSSRHRSAYSELTVSATKNALEGTLRCGFIQVLERLSRVVLRPYLLGKAKAAAMNGECDVLLERRRLKLHMSSHKNRVLATLVNS